jgi:hypothetical protein
MLFNEMVIWGVGTQKTISFSWTDYDRSQGIRP